MLLCFAFPNSTDGAGEFQKTKKDSACAAFLCTVQTGRKQRGYVHKSIRGDAFGLGPSELRAKGVLGSQVCGASRKLGDAMQDGVVIIGRRYR